MNFFNRILIRLFINNFSNRTKIEINNENPTSQPDDSRHLYTNSSSESLDNKIFDNLNISQRIEVKKSKIEIYFEENLKSKKVSTL